MEGQIQVDHKSTMMEFMAKDYAESNFDRSCFVLFVF